MPETGQSQPVLLAFDVGNTSTKVAVRSGGTWRHLLRVGTRPVQALCDRLLAGAGELSASPRPNRCLLCSVVPAASEGVRAACADLELPAPEVFGERLAVPLPTAVPEPERVGQDRLLIALGAKESAGAPCVAVSAGTAITVDLVDGHGAFAGGAIAPGLRLSALALHQETALLPLVGPAPPEQEPGQTSEQALLSGVYRSAVGGILSLLRRYRQRPGCERAAVVCTGADAPLLLPGLLEGAEVRHEPDLLFIGMEKAAEAQG